MKRVWVVLQNDMGIYLDNAQVVGVYTDFDTAEKVRAKLTELYTQRYYIEDVVLDLDLWNDK